MNLIGRAYQKIVRESDSLLRETGGRSGIYNQLYRNASGRRIIVYHGICRKGHTRFSLTFLEQQTLETHLQFFKKHFKVVSLEEYFGNSASSQFTVCLSFDLRRAGLFGQLASSILELAISQGIELLFGFPNQDAFPALLKNDWVWKEDIDRFEIPVKRSIKWYYSRLTGGSGARFRKSAGSIHSILRDGFDGLDRNEKYIDYKLSLGNYGIIESAAGKPG